MVPQIASPVGRRLRARIRARDVMLALDRPDDISAINVLAAVVTGVRIETGPFAEVQVRIGSVPLIARITRHSAARLDLAPGQRLFAVIKSVAIDRRSLSLPEEEKGEETGAAPEHRPAHLSLAKIMLCSFDALHGKMIL